MNPFSENHFSKHIKMFLSDLKFVLCLCKRKDVKGAEESQPTGPRSRYEPYWTYQVQDGWSEHVALSNPVRGGVTPPLRAAPGRGCNPTVKDSWETQCLTLTHVAFKKKSDFHEDKKKFAHVQQTDAALTDDWRQWQCDTVNAILWLEVKTFWKVWEIHLSYIYSYNVVEAHLK